MGKKHERESEEVEPLLKWFEYGHLCDELKETSRLFGDLAHELVAFIPRSAERTVALRKLLEAKDAAVRATLESMREMAAGG